MVENPTPRGPSKNQRKVDDIVGFLGSTRGLWMMAVLGVVGVIAVVTVIVDMFV